MKVRFDENFDTSDEKAQDVMINLNDNWVRYGVLEFDEDQDCWVLWCGEPYSDDSLFKVMDKNPDGTSYWKSLKETKDDVVDDLQGWYDDYGDDLIAE